MFNQLLHFTLKFQLSAISFILSFLPLAPLHAMELIPVSTNSLNPFIAGKNLLQPQHWFASDHNQPAIHLQIQAANYSIKSETSKESIILDGEVYQSILTLHYPISEQITVKASVPYIHYSGGIMDDAIEQWHQWFGLSNSRRTEFPSHQLHYEYLKDGVSEARVIHQTDGLGDISLGLSILPESWQDAKAYSLSFNMDLKLPSGDPERLTGSGASDFGLSVHAIMHPDMSSPLALYGGLGVIFPGQGEIITTSQKGHSYSAYTGIHWKATTRLVLTTQLNLQTALYESTLDELGKDSVQLLFSATYQAARGLLYQFSIGENLFTDATPDFSLHFAIHLK